MGRTAERSNSDGHLQGRPDVVKMDHGLEETVWDQVNGNMYLLRWEAHARRSGNI